MEKDSFWSFILHLLFSPSTFKESGCCRTKHEKYLPLRFLLLKFPLLTFLPTVQLWTFLKFGCILFSIYGIFFLRPQLQRRCCGYDLGSVFLDLLKSPIYIFLFFFTWLSQYHLNLNKFTTDFIITFTHKFFFS